MNIAPEFRIRRPSETKLKCFDISGHIKRNNICISDHEKSSAYRGSFSANRETGTTYSAIGLQELLKNTFLFFIFNFGK